MQLEFNIGSGHYAVDATKYFDISIPLCFNQDQPQNYGVEKASSTPLGDVRAGDACNYDKLTLVPHCNGTHTECLGHITKERNAIHYLIKDVWIPTCLISVTPKDLDGDQVITKAKISQELMNTEPGFLKGIVIRTLPNLEDKLSKDYNQVIPPYLDLEAMNYLNELGVEHLIVDIPSVDRIYDGGKLKNHKTFWNLNDIDVTRVADEVKHKTITEMAFVANNIHDGSYLLNLQVAPFVSDAAPSRPLLFPIIKSL